MNYQITDAKTRYFNDKEHYLNFLKAWKRAANSVNRKSTKNETYGNQEPGWLTGAHMLLYAILRGKDARSAFTPITKETKLRNGFYINHGMYWAYDNLQRIIKAAGAEEGNKWQDERVATFLAPFNGTIEREVLAKIELPEIKPLYSDYGPGKAIAETLIETDETDNEALWNIIEEAA